MPNQLAITGNATMWMAIFADMGAGLIVVANGVSLLRGVSRSTPAADTMQNMRRLFAIFLLVLLPLQLSWATVAVYCQHETDGQAKHVGHHDHQHQAGDDQGATDTPLSGGVDNDCGTCHAGYAPAIFGETPISSPADVSARLDDYRRSPNTSPHYLPERPNWVPLA